MTQLTVVGSGDAFNAAGRRHSCYLLDGEGLGPLMIDFGATALAGLRQLGRDPASIRGFAFTHLHGDHVGGWPFLVIDGMFNGLRAGTLDVVGPVGTAARLDAHMRVAYGDVMDRDKPFTLRIREIAPGQAAAHAGATIAGFAAEHMDPPEQPLCLRVTTPSGAVVAFSGDTAMCDGLRAAADGADLLVAECSGLAPPCGRHITWQDWRASFATVRAKRILLTHLGEAVRAKVPELLREAPDHVSFADDGMLITLP